MRQCFTKLLPYAKNPTEAAILYGPKNNNFLMVTYDASGYCVGGEVVLSLLGKI